MHEMKQLWMNPLFKQIVRWLLLIALSTGFVYFSYDHWIQHRSWLELLGYVVLFQLVIWAIVFFSKRIPWGRLANGGYQRLSAFFTNDEADQDIAVMRADLRALKQSLDIAQKKLPLLLGFEPKDSGFIEQALLSTKIKVIPLKQSSPLVHFVLTESAVICLCEENLRVERGKRWSAFLHLLSKHFGLFSTISAVIWTMRQNLEECRYQLDEMMRVWHRSIPIYGVCEALSSDALLKCSLSNLPQQEHSTLLQAFFDQILKKTQWLRYCDVEESKTLSQKWDKFLTPSRIKAALNNRLAAWQSLVQYSDFHCPSMLKRLTVTDASPGSYQTLWEDLMAFATVDKKQRCDAKIDWSLARRMQIACMGAVFLVAVGAVIWQALHVRSVFRVHHALVNAMPQWGNALAAQCDEEANLRIALTLLNHSPDPLKEQIEQVLSWASFGQELGQDEARLVQEVLEMNDGKWPSNALSSNPVLRTAIAMARYRLEGASTVSAFSAQLAMAERSALWGTMDLSDSLAPASRDLLLLKESVPRLYTTKGWTEYVQPLIEQFEAHAQQQQWILAALDVRSHENIKKRLTQYYLKQYAKQWESFFQGVSIRHFLNTQDAVIKLTHLVDEDSAWISLLQFSAENLKPLMGFKAMPLSEYQEGLVQIKSEMEGLLFHADFGREIEQYVQLIFARHSDPTSGLTTLAHKVRRFHKPGALGVQNAFTRLLMQPLIRVYLAASKDALLHLEKDWYYQIISPFRMNLSNKFPFQNTKQEVSLADFTVFFSPKQGKIAQFIQDRVQPLTLMHQGKLIPKQWLGSPLPISTGFLASIDYLVAFSQGFFSEDTATPSVKFQIMPEPSPAFTHCSLEVDGTAYIYKNDPEEWKLLRWPGESPYPKSSFTVTLASSKSNYFETISGEWSFFKLLKQYGNFEEDSPGYYRVSFKINPSAKPMIFRIKTAAATDVFKLISMDKFELVDKIYGQS